MDHLTTQAHEQSSVTPASANAATYTLSYVNKPEWYEVFYDRDFRSFEELDAFVAQQHPDFTSYQVIVVR
jgi:hypothetical protein